MSKKALFHQLLAECIGDPELVNAIFEVVQDAQAEAIYRQAVLPDREPLLDERDWWHIYADGKIAKL